MGEAANGWRDRAVALGAELSAVGNGGLDGGLRRRIVKLWRHLATAPPEVEHEYGLIPEAAMLRASDAATERHRHGRYMAPLAPDASVAEAVLAVGGALRALDKSLSDLTPEGFPADPNADWRVEEDGEAFLVIPIARIAWREARPPEQDYRPFSQRGLTRMRIVPAAVDGIPVKIHVPDRLSRPGRRPAFGAVLFPSPKFDDDGGTSTFRIVNVSGPEMETIALTSCRSAHADGCTVLVFPELTINDVLLDRIRDALGEKPWTGEAGQPYPTPSVVVAGSWHRPVEGGYSNAAPVLDGDGEPLLQHRKRFAYRDEGGRREDIVPGDELAILVLNEGLFAFGLCLDFCHRSLSSPYGTLDVDFVLVPSCGNERTMYGHMRTAADLLDQRKTRSFVVQQAWPPIKYGLGYILPPGQDLMTLKARCLASQKTWSVIPVSALTPG